MAKTKCLSVTALRLFNDGQLSATDIKLVGQHLEQCPDCLQRLESFEPGPLEQGIKGAVTVQRPNGEDANTIDENAKQILSSVFPDDAPTIDSQHGQDLFQLGDRIGQTRFGNIFAAVDLVMQRPVTIIIPDSGLIASIDHRAQLIHDANLASCLHHENIIPLNQFGAWDQIKCYLAMPEITGCSLQRILDSDQHFNLNAILVVVGQICQALKYAHSHNVLHRHLNPMNVFVDDDLGVQVSEFGLTVDGRYQFELIQPLNDPTRFDSPESVKNELRQIDARSDVFSVGAILEFLLKKSPALDSTNKSALTEIAEKCQLKSRRSRFQTIKQLIESVGERVQANA